jgi:hypothetical protein
MLHLRRLLGQQQPRLTMEESKESLVTLVQLQCRALQAARAIISKA